VFLKSTVNEYGYATYALIPTMRADPFCPTAIKDVPSEKVAITCVEGVVVDVSGFAIF
jgi:hypothetical protein